MLSRIPRFVESFKQLNIDIPSLRAQISKPIRPTWVTQESTGLLSPSSPDHQIFEAFHPVICCTSSRRITDGEMSHSGYVQGAGDDTENWALGLTPPMFWEHMEQLVTTPDPGLPELIRSLISQGDAERHASGGCGLTVRELTPFLFVCPLPIPEEGNYTCKIALGSSVTSPDTWIKSSKHMEVGIGKHKVASRNLRVALPLICSFVSQLLNKKEENTDGQRRIIVSCDTGKDLSIGVALALLCWCFDDRDNIKPGDGDATFNKTVIKVKLGRIMNAVPDANPNRATLQSVNSFLMDWVK